MDQPNPSVTAKKLRSFFVLSIIVSIGGALFVAIPGHLDRDFLSSLVTFDLALAGIAVALVAVMVAELRRGLQLLGNNLPPSLFDEVIDKVTKPSENDAEEYQRRREMLRNSFHMAGTSLKRGYRILIRVGDYVIALLVILPPVVAAFLALVAQAWISGLGVWFLGLAALALTVWTLFDVVYVIWVLYAMRTAGDETSTKGSLDPAP